MRVQQPLASPSMSKLGALDLDQHADRFVDGTRPAAAHDSATYLCFGIKIQVLTETCAPSIVVSGMHVASLAPNSAAGEPRPHARILLFLSLRGQCNI